MLLPAVVAAVGTGSVPRAAAQLPSRFTESVVFSGLNAPTAVRFSPDGRVFVAEKRGVVKVFDSLADTTPTVFLDLRTQVFNFWDRGLLGLALAPDFPADPGVYVLYSRDAAIGGTAPRWGTAGADSDGCPSPPGPTVDGCVISGRLSRFVAVGDVAGAEQVLIDDWCQQFPSHSVGSLAFGADGALYASAGEGASFTFRDYGQTGNPVNPCGDPPGGVGVALTAVTSEGGSLRAQDMRTTDDPAGLSGAVIRIDPFTGEGLPTNPSAASSDANARRIVAMGLRNPFRITVRPGTDEVWVGDVGSEQREEIDRLVDAGGTATDNFGWPCYEGTSKKAAWVNSGNLICAGLYAEGAAGVTDPYYAYAHGAQVADETCATTSSSVTGLAFYEGGDYPDDMDGALFFADYSRGCIWAMPAGAGGLPDPTAITTFDSAATGVVDLQVGPGGDLFYVDMTNGRVVRISYHPEESPPTPVIAADPTTGHAPLDVQFSAAGTTDVDGGTITYEWDLDGDGQYDDSTAVAPTQRYTVDGDVTVGLRATDDTGLSAVTSRVVHVGNSAPTPVIVTPLATLTWSVGQTVSFSGTATDPEDGALPATAMTWSLVMMHCHTVGECHEHVVQSYTGVGSGSFVAPDHDYPSYLELRLTATDAQGLHATVVRRLYPTSVTLSFTSAVPGVPVTVGDMTTLTPFTQIVIKGSTNSVGAPPSIEVDGVTYRFTRWSDRGALEHLVTPTADTHLIVDMLGPLVDGAAATASAIRRRCDVPAATQVRCGAT